jgi:uncharacterized membrane protein YgcG
MIRCSRCRELYNPPQFGMRHVCRPSNASQGITPGDDAAFIASVSPYIPSPSSSGYETPAAAPASDPSPSYSGGGGDSGGGGSSGDY